MTSNLFVVGVAASCKALTLSRIGCRLSESILCPRYSYDGAIKLHLIILSVRPASFTSSSTLLRVSKCASSIGAVIRISSMYMATCGIPWKRFSMKYSRYCFDSSSNSSCLHVVLDSIFVKDLPQANVVNKS